ncbi:MAG TPA: protein-L-isoaspartate O-methyltransferase [Rhodanobacteraceae bacterium]
MTLNFEQARRNMINNQVRPWDVVDMAVLDALGRVHREDFVADHLREQAFVDVMLPLGHGEVMLKPVLEGRILQALGLGKDDRVLEIGTGSGYLTACMATLAGHVTSIDIHADFTDTARARLARAGIDNVALDTADAMRDFQPNGRFDAVVVTGAVPEIPAHFQEWLKPASRLFVIAGQSPVMTAWLTTTTAQGQRHEQSLFETDLPYLVHAAPAPAFTL